MAEFESKMGNITLSQQALVDKLKIYKLCDNGTFYRRMMSLTLQFKTLLDNDKI